MAKRHERIITKQRIPGSGPGEFYERIIVECACGWWERCGVGKRGRQRATYVYREHIEKEMARSAKPSPFEPEVGISSAYWS